MEIKTYGTLALVAAFSLIITIFSGCGNSEGDGLALGDIPRYPDATEGEAMAHSSFGGVVGGSLAQYTTTDPYDEVVDFYTEALANYDTEVISHKSELGRQAAISVPKENGMTSIAIQEFTEEGTVNITFMEVGS